MGTTSALIGGLVMILIPIVQYFSFGGFDVTLLRIYGLLLVGVVSFGGAEGISDFEFFDIDWFDNGGYYEFLFGESLYGIIILILVIFAIILTFILDSSPVTGGLFIAAAVLMLLFRFQQLDDQNLFFFESEGGVTFIEIPLGVIAGLIVGIKNLKSD